MNNSLKIQLKDHQVNITSKCINLRNYNSCKSLEYLKININKIIDFKIKKSNLLEEISIFGNRSNRKKL